jgi:hypothetical protein
MNQLVRRVLAMMMVFATNNSIAPLNAERPNEHPTPTGSEAFIPSLDHCSPNTPHLNPIVPQKINTSAPPRVNLIHTLGYLSVIRGRRAAHVTHAPERRSHLVHSTDGSQWHTVALLPGPTTAHHASPLDTRTTEREEPMSSYTITITPDPTEERTSNTSPQTTIKVDTSSGEPRITEVSIRSAAPDGLQTGTASVVDLELLVRALTSGTGKPNSAPAVVTERPTSPGSRQTASEPDGIHPAPTGKTSASPSDRTYRRMPKTAEVLAAYEQIGTITGVAKHFGVPRHTAQGWMTRIRKRS